MIFTRRTFSFIVAITLLVITGVIVAAETRPVIKNSPVAQKTSFEEMPKERVILQKKFVPQQKKKLILL